MHPRNTWGIALETLRKKRRPQDLHITKKKVKEVSQSQMQELGIAPAKDYRNWLKGEQGPTTKSLAKWLHGMKYSWHDWADAMEAAEALTDVTKHSGHPLQSRHSENHPVAVEDHPPPYATELSPKKKTRGRPPRNPSRQT